MKEAAAEVVARLEDARRHTTALESKLESFNTQVGMCRWCRWCTQAGTARACARGVRRVFLGGCGVCSFRHCQNADEQTPTALLHACRSRPPSRPCTTAWQRCSCGWRTWRSASRWASGWGPGGLGSYKRRLGGWLAGQQQRVGLKKSKENALPAHGSTSSAHRLVNCPVWSTSLNRSADTLALALHPHRTARRR